MEKKKCCDWHQGICDPCEVCDDPKACAWIFGDYGEEKQILCYKHHKELEKVTG